MTTIAPPKTVFDDVKPWPKADAAENPRAVMGGNAPPLDEMIVIELNEALDAKDGFRAKLAELLAKGKDPADCEDDDRAGRYGDYVRIAKAAQAFIDGERERIKAPYWAAIKALDGAARVYRDDLGDAISRVQSRLNVYAAKVAKAQADEAKRIADEIEALRKKAADDAAAEQAKQQAVEDARAAREQREAVVVEVVPEPVFVPPAAAYNPLGVGEAPAAVRGDLGSRVGFTRVWKSEVVNIRQLPDHVLKHPDVIAAAAKVVQALVKPKNGIRELKGARIWSEDQASVR